MEGPQEEEGQRPGVSERGEAGGRRDTEKTETPRKGGKDGEAQDTEIGSQILAEIEMSGVSNGDLRESLSPGDRWAHEGEREPETETGD